MRRNKVSVIIPVYQAEAFLARCLESVLAQGYPHWEAIVVDDGSPDRSGEIAEEYARKDSRFKVIHQPNSGQAAARNRGLDLVTGEYIAFLDSDDYWTDEDVLFRVVTRLEKDQLDILRADTWRVYRKKTKRLNNFPESSNRDEIFADFLAEKIDSTLCVYFFKSVLWQGIRFPVGEVAEDHWVIAELMNKAKRMAIVNDPVYCYNLTNELSTMKSKDIEVLWATIRSLVYRLEQVESGAWRVVDGTDNRIKGALAARCVRALRVREMGRPVEIIDFEQVVNRLRAYYPYLSKPKDWLRAWLFFHFRAGYQAWARIDAFLDRHKRKRRG